MTDPRELKRQQLMQAMASSLASTPAQNPVIPQPSVRMPEAGVGMQAPPELAEPPAVAPIRVGFGAKGLQGADRDMLKRQAQREADPESKVVDSGDFFEIAPPRGKNEQPEHGLLSRLGRGAGIGAASADPDNPNAVLGGLIGGALGGISPRNYARNERKYDIGQTENDIQRGLKLEEGQEQVHGLRALTGQREAEPGLKAAEIDRKAQYDNERLRIEEDRVRGLLTKAEADNKQRELDRKSREDIAEKNRINQKEIAGMPARANGKDTTAKHEAARSELAQLEQDEAKAGEAKNKAYAVLEQMRKDGNPKEDITQAASEAERANQLYQSFGDKKREAKRRMDENQPQTVEAPSGAKWSASKWAKTHPDKDVESAKKAAQAKGYVIVD